MPGFYASAVKEIYEVKSEYGDDISSEDALQFYIDPHHKPLVGIQCSRDLMNEKHSTECDSQLHDALTLIFTSGISNRSEDETYRKLHEAFRLVRRRLLMYGAKIP